MNQLNVSDFAEFFTALWGKDRPPFAWQYELAKRVLEKTKAHTQDSPHPDALSSGETKESPWPEAITLPTASGKTTCIDIAVFTLAAQMSWLNKGQPVSAPRRIFFVVDRRIIVDEAYDRAKQIASKLEKAKKGILKEVADNLRQISCGKTTHLEKKQPLATYILRGGMYRSEAWARNPLQPTVVTSTVDQIGSRLLFRAYGRGSGTWPIYAGLVANDSLIFLDEAHCAQPFLQTLRAVQHFKSWGGTPLNRSFYPVIMSATPPPGINDQFKDKSKERKDPNHPLGRRQLAHKPATLEIIKKTSEKQKTHKLAKGLADTALSLINEQRRAIVIFVNRVTTARETYQRLREQENMNTAILTGRMRAIDKDIVYEKHLGSLKSSQFNGHVLTKPLVVVATQTLEVGADLDFDGLVTECASLDALRQRFGRLNRMGRPIDARATILIYENQINEDDPIYGQALSKTWNWLDKSKNENGEIDFGIAYLDRILPKEDCGLNAPSLNAPVMLPAHIDCWAQTSPEPCPSPDIAPFLHGPQKGAADVQVCWRADIDLAEKEKDALDLLRICPPSSNETIPVPIGVFKRWLAREETTDNSSDVESIKESDEVKRERPPEDGRCIVRWRGAKTEVKDITPDHKKIRPGDIIVIPTNHPGSWKQIGDLPPENTQPYAPLDIGDQAYRLTRAKPILRLHPKLIESWPDSLNDLSIKDAANELLNNLQQKFDDDPSDVTDALHGILKKLADSDQHVSPYWTWLPQAAKELIDEYSRKNIRHGYHIVGTESLILVGRNRLPYLAQEANNFDDEDDTNASGISYRNGQPVKLSAHLPGVEEFAHRHADSCGLPNDLTSAISRAGLLHDLGKADPRFQSLLQNGNRWLGEEPLAKSARMPKTRAAYEEARERAECPKGWRHELLSVRMAESAPDLLPEENYLRDLTLHLIASHHGRCRPFAPVIEDNPKEDVDFELNGHNTHWSGPTGLEQLDSGIAERYWRLVRRYNWWGLAWLEALLRLADWRRSEWEETHNADD